MSETKGQTKARLHCANYDSTDKTCLGIMLKVEKIKDEMGITRTKLFQWRDSEKEGRICIVEQGCDYFDKVVAPIIRVP